MCSQFCSLLSVSGVVSKVRRCSPISSKHVSLWWLFFNPHLITLIKYRSLINKSNRIRHGYLRQIKFRIYPNRGLASSLDCLYYGNERECYSASKYCWVEMFPLHIYQISQSDPPWNDQRCICARNQHWFSMISIPSKCTIGSNKGLQILIFNFYIL